MNERRRLLFAVLAVAAVVAASVTAAILLDLGRGGSTLPPGCSQPSGGFLIVADGNGYNNSVSHGANATWPVLAVKQGTLVTITVCNNDRQAHGFQITHYFDDQIVSLAPHQVLKISFVADQVGRFRIYCSTFCTIHLYMQHGQLEVTQ